MNSNSIIPSVTSSRTKEDFINQAHEARQARELSRRREKSATLIQAFLKSVLVRKRLRERAVRELKELTTNSEHKSLFDWDLLTLIKKLLFVCHEDRDKEILDSLLEYISTNFDKSSFTPATNHAETKAEDTNKVLADDDKKDSSSSDKEHLKVDNDSSIDGTLVKVVELSVSKDEKFFNDWLVVLERVMNICIHHLRPINFTKIDSHNMHIYLSVIDLLTSKVSFDKVDVQSTPDFNTFSRLSSELINRLSALEVEFFKNMTSLLAESLNKIRLDLECKILLSYTQLVTRRLHLDIPNIFTINLLNNFKKKELIDTVILPMLCVPGLVYHLEKYSHDALINLNKHSTFHLSILMLSDVSDFQRLTSTSSLCLLANLVHLASLNEAGLTENKMEFIILTTKLLESCQKNMLQLSTANQGAQKMNPIVQQTKKKNEAKDVSFNPLLGWLAREQSTYIDKDIIKSQINHLWSIRFIKILLSDLNKFNENTLSLNPNTISKSQVNNHSNLKIKSTTSKNNLQNQLSCDNNPSSQSSNIFKRAIERATSTMNRTLSCSYAKTTGASGSSGIAKLLSPEANRISLVCCMLHTTLNTLSTMKQEILNGLCLHEYILPNLWTFISSLGPQNGLKAFLEHLTICSKTNAPEFYVLILFCECASHLISILDDSELYEKQQPFRLEDLIAISSFLNNFVFRTISSNLITFNPLDLDPLLRVTHKLLTDLYKRDCRRKFSPQDHWLIKDIKISIFLRDLEAGKPIAKTIMTLLPHIIPHKERVIIFRKLIAKDRAQNSSGLSTLITIHRYRIVEDGYLQLARLQPQALKGLIRVKFINDYGLDEAGIDQDGVFKEFLEDTIKRVFDPALNLFCSTSEQRLYPSPTSRLHEDYLSLFNFVGKMLGKAIYEGIVVDVPFASFFLSRVLGQPQTPLYSPIDELPSLDPELYKSLTYIKHYDGDVSELDLTFSIDHDFMGKIETYELEPGGKTIPVTRESRVRYIHSVANFRMKTQIEKQTEAFVSGFKSIINLEWLSMFSTSEFQRIISGDTTPIDLQDLRRHTKYFGGFHNNHRVVCWLWDILEKDYTAEEHSLFLKFVTSCSKPPLLGFANLEPTFSIRCVEVGDDQDLGDTVGSVLRGYFAIRRSDPVDRLPTSSTCFNMLKLPNYQRRATLRDKLRYAIRSNPGFELS